MAGARLGCVRTKVDSSLGSCVYLTVATKPRLQSDASLSVISPVYMTTVWHLILPNLP